MHHVIIDRSLPPVLHLLHRQFNGDVLKLLDIGLQDLNKTLLHSLCSGKVNTLTAYSVAVIPYHLSHQS